MCKFDINGKIQLCLNSLYKLIQQQCHDLENVNIHLNEAKGIIEISVDGPGIDDIQPLSIDQKENLSIHNSQKQ